MLFVLAITSAAAAVPAPVDCNQGHKGPAPSPHTRPLPKNRPAVEDRTFTSPALERHLDELVNNRTWKTPELATLLWNCLPNTLDTTVWQAPSAKNPSVSTFISTGDIAAMWLRDSQNQVLPYIRYAKEEPEVIGALLRGLIKRHVESVLLDPYANSFDYFHTKSVELKCNPGAWTKDNTTIRNPHTGHRENGMRAGVHQRKWEMDSLSSMLKLGRLYHEATGDARPFDAQWESAVATVVDTYREMQAPLDPSNFTSVNYTFQTLTHEPKDTSAHGIGRNHRWTGMVRTSFLPSDDSPRLPYHVPGNAFAVVELRGVASMLRAFAAQREGHQADADEEALHVRFLLQLAAQASALANEIHSGIEEWGIVHHGKSGARIYAMEVDGFGNHFFGDDANVPSLLGLPFIGYVNVTDPVYKATRKLLLSNRTNPYFYGCGVPGDCGGGILGGIGSEDASGNAGLGHVWPLSLHIRLLTVDFGPGPEPSAEAEEEVEAILRALVESSGGTGLMHESYWYTDSSMYTRFWFAMANSYLGESLLYLSEYYPKMLFK